MNKKPSDYILNWYVENYLLPWTVLSSESLRHPGRCVKQLLRTELGKQLIPHLRAEHFNHRQFWQK